MMYTTDQAAITLNITANRVRQLCRAGLIDAIQPGRDWLIDDAALRQFATRRRGPGNPNWVKRPPNRVSS